MAELNRREDTRNGTPPGSAAAAAMLREAESWANVQCEVLSGVEAMWIGWMQRRREAIDASTRSFAQICECSNLVEIVQIQQQWLADAVQRTTSDLSALANDAAALTWPFTRIDRTGDSTRKPGPPARRQGEAPLHREAAE
jgi:hypothetical protein